MSDDSFFGDVFEEPEDDPLLQSDDESASPDEDVPVPSWMMDNSSTPNQSSSTSSEHTDPSASSAAETEVAHRSIPIDWESGTTQGLDALNEAVSGEWRITRLDLTRPDLETADLCLTVTLEREDPQSLFEFPNA